MACFVSQFDPFSRKQRPIFFLKQKYLRNSFQWDVLKNMRQIKSYDDIFQAIRALAVHKACQNESFFRFLSNALI